MKDTYTKKKIATIKTYNKSAEALAERFDKFGARKAEIKEAFSYAKITNPKVVELGCGNGRDAAEIIKHTNDYLGIDASKSLLALAKKKVPSANFRLADLEKFSFPSGVNIIFAFASLLHSRRSKLKQVLNKAHKALSSKGIFYISLQLRKYQKLEIQDIYGQRTFYFYEPTDIKYLAAEKYKVLKVRKNEFRNGKWFIIILQKR